MSAHYKKKSSEEPKRRYKSPTMLPLRDPLLLKLIQASQPVNVHWLIASFTHFAIYKQI